MTIVAQGSTPTLQLTLPNNIDLSQFIIFFSVEQFGRLLIEKNSATSSDITYTGNVVSVYLSQIETLQFEEGIAKVQINVVTSSGLTRVPTYEAEIEVTGNQIKKVIP